MIWAAADRREDIASKTPPPATASSTADQLCNTAQAAFRRKARQLHLPLNLTGQDTLGR